MVMGFNKTILIPDVCLSQENLKNVLLHETWHIKNHDVCNKQIINLLVIMYWWFIPVYRLRDKIDLFLENAPKFCAATNVHFVKMERENRKMPRKVCLSGR